MRDVCLIYLTRVIAAERPKGPLENVSLLSMDSKGNYLNIFTLLLTPIQYGPSTAPMCV